MNDKRKGIDKSGPLIIVVLLAGLILAITFTRQTPVVQQLDKVTFKSSHFSCQITSTSVSMLGFGKALWNYTPSQSGNILVTVNWVIWHPPGDHDANYTLAYGTGTAPSCAGSATGTTKGNTFSTSSLKQNGAGFDSFVSQSETFTLVNLTKGTTYWFDLQVSIEMAVTHQFFNPQLSVLEI